MQGTNTVPKQRRVRNGSAPQSKSISWRLVKTLAADLDACPDPSERTSIARALATALSVHHKYIEACDIQDRLDALEQRVQRDGY